jgi:hypothetical protein
VAQEYVEQGGAPTGSSGSSSDAKQESRFLPGLWTAGAILSVVANLVLLTILIGTWTGLGGITPGSTTLLDLYAGLEGLDDAHIRATIPLQTSLPLDASIPVSASTNITLTRDVRIPNAHVIIDTGQIKIDDTAAVTLPAGTALDVALNVTLPLQTSIPISVDVPLDIAIRDTELHAPIQAMKDSLRPILCSAAPGSLLPDGTAACR